MSFCSDTGLEKPSVSTLLGRGWRRKCPCCGEQPLFKGYTKVVDDCQQCGAKLGELRADDFPPYITMFVVGHIIVPLVLLAERFYAPSMTFHLLVWLPLTALLSVVMLPRVKGLIVGWMVYLGIRGDETY